MSYHRKQFIFNMIQVLYIGFLLFYLLVTEHQQAIAYFNLFITPKYKSCENQHRSKQNTEKR